jgi:hypothetical protein
MRDRSWRDGTSPARAGAWSRPGVWGLVVAAFFAACGTANPPGIDQTGTMPGGGCASPGTAGCPCSEIGQSVACGDLVAKSGAYVTCSMGHSKCDGHAWGACLGNTIVQKSLTGRSLAADGLRPLYTTSACTNLCDPNPSCTGVTGDPGDVDASNVFRSPEGGITLLPNDAAPDQGASGCQGLQCNVVSCAGDGGLSTTITGTVYDPAGKNPLYNATVYVPVNAATALPSFTTGVSCDQCGGAAALNAVAVTQTGTDGTFTLTRVPSGVNIPIVVQMGKWRREILLTTVLPCTGNSVTSNCTATDPSMCALRLPKNKSDGYDPVAGTYTRADLPQMAIVSGSADPLECLLLKAGISPGEFGSYRNSVTTNPKVHFFQSPNAPGTTLDSQFGAQYGGDVLWLDNGDPAPGTPTAPHYDYYDVVLLPCEGASIDKEPLYTSRGGGEPYKNLIQYTNLGGRAFVTHFGYVWLEYPSATAIHNPAYVTGDNWANVASWASQQGTTYTQDPLTANLITTFPKGMAFSQWLLNVGASAPPGGQLVLHEAREDLYNPFPAASTSQGWMSATNTNPPRGITGNFDPHFTFNTPYTASSANQCGRVVYSDFHVSAAALVGGNGTCLETSDCGYAQTCYGATQAGVGACTEPCTTSADCADSTYTCSGATAGSCAPKACTAGTTSYTCPIGACTANTVACWCTADRQCASGKCASWTGCNGNGPCSGAAGMGGADNCIPDAASACTGTWTCSNPMYPCNAQHTGCVLPASLPNPTYACSNANLTCAANHTSCNSCTANNQCSSPLTHCGGANTDAVGCGIPAALPNPTGGTYTCPTGTLSCDGAHNCGPCSNDNQCPSGRCFCFSGNCNGQWDDPRDAANCVIPATIAPQCQQDNQCGAYSRCSSWNTDSFGCRQRQPNDCQDSSDCDHGGVCTNSVCQCNNDSQCGTGSKCTNNACGAGHTCTGSGPSDGFGCTTRTSPLACTANGPLACSGGACKSSTCVCTDNSQCASRKCASPGGTCTGTCTGAAGTGGTDNCVPEVLTCSTTGSMCATGAADPSNQHCWCTNDNQCASNKCATWARCTGNNCTGAANAGSATDHCVPETIPSCTASCTTGAADPSNQHCWCTSDNQCATSKCESWSGCAGNICTGAAGQGSSTDHCVTNPVPTCSASSPYSCAAGMLGACNASHNCVCNADSQCGAGGKCVCAGAGCTGMGAANQYGCQAPTAIPATCTANTSYSCGVGVCNSAGTSCLCTADNQCPSGQCVDRGQGCAGACSGAASASIDAADCVTSTSTTCSTNTNCGGPQAVESCVGGSGGTPGLGNCSKACTTNANCTGGETCVAGFCTGCTSNTQCTDKTFRATCSGGATSHRGSCCFATNPRLPTSASNPADPTNCSTNSGRFPQACVQSPMSAQEKALEFMFFDLTACVTPDQAPTGPPPIKLNPQTFPLDFVASCPTDAGQPLGTTPKWREFDFQASFPSPVNGSSISFAAQTGPVGGDGSPGFVPSTPLPLTTATTNTALPGYDVVLLDSSPGGSGRFTTASPPLASQAALRIWVTMTPTSDQMSSPTLLSWKLVYDCPPSE